MTALTLAARACVVPRRQTFDGVVAVEQHGGYTYLLTPLGQGSRPQAAWGLREADLRRLRPTRPARLAVAPPGVAASDLALQAVTALVRDVGAERLARVDALLYASATVNQQIGESVAGRLQHALQAAQALPVGLSQCGTHACYVALELAQALLAQRPPGAEVLLVAADKWLHPFVRSYGDLACYGDAAAALLLRRAADGPPAPGEVRLRAVRNLCRPIDAPPWRQDWRATSGALTPGACAALDALRALDPGTAPGLVVPPGLGDVLLDEVGRRAGLSAASVFLEARAEYGHLSCADPIVALGRALDSPRSAGVRALWSWDCSLDGAFGAALWERGEC